MRVELIQNKKQKPINPCFTRGSRGTDNKGVITDFITFKFFTSLICNNDNVNMYYPDAKKIRKKKVQTTRKG